MRKNGLHIALITKILMAFTISGLALGGLYFFSRQAIREIDRSYEEIASPDQKLNAVNRLYAEIIKSDLALTAPLTPDDFTLRSGIINEYADTLRVLCSGNEKQTLLLDSIISLLALREQKIRHYFTFRRSLNRNILTGPDLIAIDSLISSGNRPGETTIITQIETTSTTQF
ncbi:MAG TPA: hypothetical protein VK907_06795, partial [Phnomibacter sp.]|nr:hypothetical protein [Phnomibacter sp.]